MDPNTISTTSWSDLGRLLTLLWVLVLFVIVFGFSILLAHGVVPSLVASRHIPQRTAAVRPVLYLFGLLSLAVALTLLLYLFGLMGFPQVLRDIYHRWWI